MKIIICGAGLVGASIAIHLCEELNDITVVDSSKERLHRLAEMAEVLTVEGVAANPDILKQAGASDAEMVIAVTESDEINMMACQVARHIFQTPKTIARIRHQGYLDPQFHHGLFENVEVDNIISPEVELSRAVSIQLRVPGAFDVKDLCDGKMNLVGVLCVENSHITETPIRHLTALFPDLKMTILAVIRDGTMVMPRDGAERMHTGDRVYFVCDADHLERCMSAFGHEEHSARSVLVAGGGVIARMLLDRIKSEFPATSTRVIEQDEVSASGLAEVMPDIHIIHGNALDTTILGEAGVEKVETFVSVTDNDEVNILSALLAKRQGALHAVALVNNPGFISLVSALGVDAVINPSQITVSSILEYVRRGKIIDVHAITESLGEVIEAEALESSPIIDKPLKQSHLPKGVTVGGLYRNGEVMPVRGDTVIEAGDRMVIMAARGKVASVEKLISVAANV